MAINKVYFSKEGMQAEAYAKANNLAINFSYFKLGNGKNSNPENCMFMGDVAYKVGIQSIEELEDGKFRINGLFKNSEVKKEFYFRELALYCENPEFDEWKEESEENKKEIIYCYGAAVNEEIIPPMSDNSIVSNLIGIVVKVAGGNATFTIDEKSTASLKDVQELKNLINKYSFTIDNQSKFDKWVNQEPLQDFLENPVEAYYANIKIIEMKDADGNSIPYESLEDINLTSLKTNSITGIGNVVINADIICNNINEKNKISNISLTYGKKFSNCNLLINCSGIFENCNTVLDGDGNLDLSNSLEINGNKVLTDEKDLINNNILLWDENNKKVKTITVPEGSEGKVLVYKGLNEEPAFENYFSGDIKLSNEVKEGDLNPVTSDAVARWKPSGGGGEGGGGSSSHALTADTADIAKKVINNATNEDGDYITTNYRLREWIFGGDKGTGWYGSYREDVNTLLKGGRYNVSEPFANNPFNWVYFILEVMVFDSGHTTIQVAYNAIENKIATRRKAFKSDKWTGWEELSKASTSDMPKNDANNIIVSGAYHGGLDSKHVPVNKVPCLILHTGYITNDPIYASQTAMLFGEVNKGKIYSRVKDNGVWTEWQEVMTTSTSWDFMGGKKLPDATDLDTIRDIGTYYCDSASYGKGVKNPPAGMSSSGVLKVYCSNGQINNMRTQEWTDYNNPGKMARRLSNDIGKTWTSWKIFTAAKFEYDEASHTLNITNI